MSFNSPFDSLGTDVPSNAPLNRRFYSFSPILQAFVSKMSRARPFFGKDLRRSPQNQKSRKYSRCSQSVTSLFVPDMVLLEVGFESINLAHLHLNHEVDEPVAHLGAIQLVGTELFRLPLAARSAALPRPRLRMAHRAAVRDRP